MKTILVLFSFVSLSFSANSQKVKIDSLGNYVAVKSSFDSLKVTSKPTGKTFTDSKGNVYPVMISENGKLFVIRISRNNNTYKQYLKL